MKILLLCNSHVWGGAERYVHTVAEAMASRGHAVFCVASAGSPLLERLTATPNINALSIDLGPKLAKDSAVELVLHWRRHSDLLRRKLAAWKSDLGIELLHLQFKKEQLLATPIAARLNMPVIWTEHGPLPPAFVRTPPAMWLYRRAAANTKAIICVAEYVATNLAANGIQSRQIHVCYNGVPTAGHTKPSSRAFVRGALNIASDETVIAAIGRLTTIKGLRTLIEVVPALLRAGQRLRILIVGDGPQRPELELRVAQLGIEDHVTFTGHRKDIQDVLSATDVAAMPSLTEGLPFAAMEAMAAGVPVVATTVGALPELLDFGRAGVLVRPDCPGDLEHALRGLIENPSQRSILAEVGRQRVKRLFSHEAMISRTEHIMQRSANTLDPTLNVHSAKVSHP